MTVRATMNSGKALPLLLLSCLVAVSIFAFLWSTQPGATTSGLLIGVSALPILLAIAAALAKKAVSLPFLLPGLLIFFKQNDALLTLAGNAPVIELLAFSVGVMLLFHIKHGEVQPKLSEASLIFLSLCGLLLAMMISSVNAVDPGESGRAIVTFLKDLVFACLIAFAIRDLDDLKAFVYWVVFSTSFCAAIMVYDAMNGMTLFPTYEDANWKGAIRSAGASTESVPSVATMILFGTALASVIAIRTSRGRWILACAALLGGAAIIASISRSVLATLVLAGIFLIWRVRGEPIFYRVASLAGVALLIVSLSMPQTVISKFRALATPSEDRTVSRRISYQDIGIDLFKSAPFIGIGAGNYPARYASDEFRYVSGRGTQPRPLHNLYLQFAAETGIIGAAAFLALIASVVATFWRGSNSLNETLRHYSEALLIGSFTISTQILFLSSKSFVGLWIMVGAAIAVASLIAKARNESTG